VRRLAEAIGDLTNDPDYFVDALASALETVEPNDTTRQQILVEVVQGLIEAGDFMVASKTTSSTTFVSGLKLELSRDDFDIIQKSDSLSGTAAFLSWEQDAVMLAVFEGRLHKADVLGVPRFPSWQFDYARCAPLSGLPAILQRVPSHWTALQTDQFMRIRRSDLRGRGDQAPIAWLEAGGTVDAILELLTNHGY